MIGGTAGEKAGKMPALQGTDDYYEMVLPSPWLRVMVLVSLVMTAGAWYSMISSHDTRLVNQVIAGGVTLAALVAILRYWRLRWLNIRIEAGEMTIGFPKDRVTVATAKVRSVAEAETRWGRRDLGRSITPEGEYFIVRHGTAVRLKVTGRDRDLIISSDRPQEIAAALGKTLGTGSRQ